jgi:hypothetical protein
MTDRPLRTLAFGDGSMWGAGWVREEPDGSVILLGTGSEASVRSGARLSGEEADGEWRLEAGGAGLTATPIGEAVAAGASEDGIDGWDQLVRVTGRFEQGGREHAVDCLGLRTWFADGFDLTQFESIRAVSVWFDSGDGFALTALRPRKAKAHDGDVLAAAVIAPDGSARVDDPRLSTTYGADGWPARAGLELWLAAAEDSEQQFPRRASGEATGARAEALAGGLEVRAEPFRWRGRAGEGAGMYLLARRR